MPFPEFADWKAPWDDKQEPFDGERARKYVYDVQRERHEGREELTAVKQSVTELTAARDALQTKVTTLEAEGGDVTVLKSQIADLTTKLETQATATKSAWLASVKEEFGLSDRQLGKLSGDDLESLRADARETFGDPTPVTPEVKLDADGKPIVDENPPPPPPPVRVVPGVRRVRNPGDPQDSAPKPPTREEVLAKIPL